MPALAFTSDLLLQSQLSAAADRSGVAVEIAGSHDALLAKAQAAGPGLVILDLGQQLHDLGQLVRQLRARLPAGSTIVALGPHVGRDRLAAARAAGCDEVMSRGRFHAEMDAILKRVAP